MDCRCGFTATVQSVWNAAASNVVSATWTRT